LPGIWARRNTSRVGVKSIESNKRKVCSEPTIQGAGKKETTAIYTEKQTICGASCHDNAGVGTHKRRDWGKKEVARHPPLPKGKLVFDNQRRGNGAVGGKLFQQTLSSRKTMSVDFSGVPHGLRGGMVLFFSGAFLANDDKNKLSQTMHRRSVTRSAFIDK